MFICKVNYSFWFVYYQASQLIVFQRVPLTYLYRNNILNSKVTKVWGE